MLDAKFEFPVQLSLFERGIIPQATACLNAIALGQRLHAA